jgi:hypothetical protein
VAQRIPGPVLAQRGELVVAADRRRLAHPARPVPALPEQLAPAHRVAPRQDQQVLARADRDPGVEQSERIGAHHPQSVEHDPPAPHRREPRLDRDHASRDEVGKLRRQHPRTMAPAHQRGPARVTDVPIEPVAPRVLRLAHAGELVRVGRVAVEPLDQRQTALREPAAAGDGDRIGERLSHGGVARQAPAHVEATAKQRRTRDRHHQQTEHQGGHLVGERGSGVDPEHAGGDERAQSNAPGRGEARPQPTVETIDEVEVVKQRLAQHWLAGAMRVLTRAPGPPRWPARRCARP